MQMTAQSFNTACSIAAPLLALTAGIIGLLKGQTWNSEKRRLTKHGVALLTVSLLTALTSITSWRASHIVTQQQQRAAEVDKAEMKKKADATIAAITDENTVLQGKLDRVKASLDSSYQDQLRLQRQVISSQHRSLEFSRQLQVSQLNVNWIRLSWDDCDGRRRLLDLITRSLPGKNATRGASIRFERRVGRLWLMFREIYAPPDRNDEDTSDPSRIEKLLHAFLPTILIDSEASTKEIEVEAADVDNYSFDYRTGREAIELTLKDINATFVTAPIRLLVPGGEVPIHGPDIEMGGSNLEARGIAEWSQRSENDKVPIVRASKPVLLQVRFQGERFLTVDSPTRPGRSRK
jgi:hypothetical protein